MTFKRVQLCSIRSSYFIVFLKRKIYLKLHWFLANLFILSILPGSSACLAKLLYQYNTNCESNHRGKPCLVGVTSTRFHRRCRRVHASTHGSTAATHTTNRGWTHIAIVSDVRAQAPNLNHASTRWWRRRHTLVYLLTKMPNFYARH